MTTTIRQTSGPRFTPFNELKPRYGETRSRTQIRRAVEAGKFPAPKQVSEQRIAWETSALDAHYDACPVVDYAPTKDEGEAAEPKLHGRG